MNILLINHYAGSDYYGMEFRPYLMAREWVKMGHDVTILAATFSHLRKINPIVKKDFTEEYIDGIRYIWVKACKYNGNGIMRVFNIACFYNKVKWNAKKIAKKYVPDTVIASSTYPIDIYAAEKISKAAQAKLSFEIHDLWPLSPIEIYGFKETNPVIKYLQRAEDFAFNKSDKVISLLQNANMHMIERGFSDEKFVFVPNGVVLETENTENTEELHESIKTALTALKEEGYFLLGYAGGHTKANALHYLLDAAKLMTGEKVCIILVGDGDQKKALMEQAKENNLTNVIFFDKINKKSIPNLLRIFDALYIGWNDLKLYEYGVSPNKIFDYMLAAKPVLHSINTSNDIISAAAGGVVVKVTPEAIKNGILELAQTSEEERKTMGENNRKYVTENHDYKILAKRFADAIKK